MEMRGLEFLDRRMLAAVAFTDFAGRRVRAPLAIRAGAGVRFFRKPAGEVIVTAAPGLEDYAASFTDLPAAPGLGEVGVTLDVRPATGALAPRRFTLSLPRSADPEAAASVFAPVAVTLLPGAAARPAGQVAGARVAVTRAADGFAIEGALVRLRAPGLPEAWSTTDAGGEALALLAGVALAHPGPGASVIPTLAAEVDAIVDPATARFHDPDDPAAMAAARAGEAARRTGFPDPDALAALAAGATPAQPVGLTAGEITTASIGWTP